MHVAGRKTSRAFIDFYGEKQFGPSGPVGAWEHKQTITCSLAFSKEVAASVSERREMQTVRAVIVEYVVRTRTRPLIEGQLSRWRIRIPARNRGKREERIYFPISYPVDDSGEFILYCYRDRDMRYADTEPPAGNGNNGGNGN